jgi:hypothetical protein
MRFIDTVIKFIVKKFWPWFNEFVWPYVKEHIMELIFFVIERMKDMVKQWFQKKSESRQQEASHKAQEAEQQATESSDLHEAEKHLAIAQVWREVAEQFRRDNEELKRKLDEFEVEAKTNTVTIVEDMNINVDFSQERPVLKIGETIRELPALPE